MIKASGRIGSADPATRPPAQAPAGLGDTASVRCALIERTAYGAFFIRNENYHVWDGEHWIGFGFAEMYPTYAAAFKDRRRALASAGEAGTATDSEAGVAEGEHATGEAGDARKGQP